MLICPATADESPVLEDVTDEENADYEVHYIRHGPGEHLLAGPGPSGLIAST